MHKPGKHNRIADILSHFAVTLTSILLYYNVMKLHLLKGLLFSSFFFFIYLILTTLWANSSDDKLIFFLICHQKQDLTVSKSVLGQKSDRYFNMSSAENFTQSAKP